MYAINYCRVNDVIDENFDKKVGQKTNCRLLHHGQLGNIK